MMNFTPVHGKLMKHISNQAAQTFSFNTFTSTSEKTNTENRRRKEFFKHVGNDWVCSLNDFERYVRTGKPADLSTFKRGTKQFQERVIAEKHLRMAEEMEKESKICQKLENLHFDLLQKEYEDEQNYFSKFNDLSEEKELDYQIIEESEEALSPRESDTLLP